GDAGVRVERAAMLAERGGRGGRARKSEIARCCDEQPPARRERPRDETRIDDRPMTHDGIVALCGGVDAAVVELERELDVRVLREEGIERRPEMQPPEGRRGRYTQRARERAAALGHCRRSLLHL